MGWHPYFKTEQLTTSVLSFPSKDFYACNDRSLPVKTLKSALPSSFMMKDRKFDDAYSLHKSECGFETEPYKLNFDFDYPDGSYIQVYTPPHGKSIAIEPMTCVANSFNNGIGLKELLPGESDTWKIQMDLEIN
jgi:aldose 1-epimerase